MVWTTVSELESARSLVWLETHTGLSLLGPLLDHLGAGAAPLTHSLEGLLRESPQSLLSSEALIASAAIPGNIGVLEASNAAVVAALGLAGGGALALARRIRALLWAAAGLAVYPRVEERRQ